MRRVLVVAYYFPPIGGIGSIRLARHAQYLSEHGWQATVLAPRDTPHASDPSLSFPEDRVVRSRSVELSRVGRLRGAGTIAGSEERRDARPTLSQAAKRWLEYPDLQIGWYPGAVFAGLRLLRRERFDAIYSSSNPLTAHLVARTLARRNGAPWVAEFRDPLGDRLAEDHPHRRRIGALEASIASAAKRVVMPTPSWADHYASRWGVRIDVVANGHDLEGLAVTVPDRATLTHVGTYYPRRQSLRAAWAALAQLLRDRPDLEVPRIRFVGALPGAVRAELSEFGLEQHVDTTGQLPHEQAVRAMADSTVLLASGFGVPDAISRGIVPAKLFEYLATSLPIIYLGGPDDATSLLAGQPGCFVVGSTDVPAARRALEASLDGGPYRRDADRFSRRARTGALARILDEAGN